MFHPSSSVSQSVPLSRLGRRGASASPPSWMGLLRIEGYSGHFGFPLMKINLLDFKFLTIMWIISLKYRKYETEVWELKTIRGINTYEVNHQFLLSFPSLILSHFQRDPRSRRCLHSPAGASPATSTARQPLNY